MNLFSSRFQDSSQSLDSSVKTQVKQCTIRMAVSRLPAASVYLSELIILYYSRRWYVIIFNTFHSQLKKKADNKGWMAEDRGWEEKTVSTWSCWPEFLLCIQFSSGQNQFASAHPFHIRSLSLSWHSFITRPSLSVSSSESHTIHLEALGSRAWVGTFHSPRPLLAVWMRVNPLFLYEICVASLPSWWGSNWNARQNDY